MDHLEDLIKTAMNLCNTLEKMAENEKKFGVEIAHEFEHLSYDAFKISDNLNGIKNYIKGVE